MLAAALAAAALASLASAALLIGGDDGYASTHEIAADTTARDGFETVAGDDWKGYATLDDLRRAEYFWWFDDRDVYGFVALVPDPLFGRVLRATFPRNAGAPGSSPRLGKRLPAPLDDFWLRWKMRFAPGWTTVGPDPAGSANSYKLAFFTWEGVDGRGELQFSNTTDYITGVGVRGRDGGALPFSETLLPGADRDFGHVTTEWTDGQWWEYVIHYRRTADHAAVFQYWRRRLTSGGRVSPSPWTYHGMAMRGSPVPRVAKVELGANKNKNNPTEMHIDWGPWEVVDGARFPDPFRVPFAR